jgi:hypothetical protein
MASSTLEKRITPSTDHTTRNVIEPSLSRSSTMRSKSSQPSGSLSASPSSGARICWVNRVAIDSASCTALARAIRSLSSTVAAATATRTARGTTTKARISSPAQVRRFRRVEALSATTPGVGTFR